MTDQYGRPTFEDGMNITRSLMAIDSMNQDRKRTKVEEDAYKAFSSLQKDPKADLSGIDSKAQYLAHKMFLDDQVSQSTAKLNEMRMTNEGMTQTVQQLKVIEAQDARDKKLALTALSSGDEAAFRKHARQIFNRAPNGITVKEGENGKIIKTGFDGKEEEIDDLSVDQYKEMMGAYFEMDPQEKIKARIANKQIIAQYNSEVISKAEPLMNDKGDTIYRVPAGTRDPVSGEIRDAFYIRSIDDKEPVPEKEVKGYKRMPEEARKLYEILGRKPTDTEKQIAAGTREKMKDPVEKPDTKSTMQKEAEYISSVKGVPEAEALDVLRRDKAFGELYKMYTEDIKAARDTEFDTEKLDAINQDLRQKYKIDEHIQSLFPEKKQAYLSEMPTELSPSHGRTPMQLTGQQPAATTQAPAAQPAPTAATPAQPAATGALPPDVTEEDIQFTMNKYNMTRDQVLAKLKG